MNKGLGWKHTFTAKRESAKYIGGIVGTCMILNLAFNWFCEPFCDINSNIYKDDPASRAARINIVKNELKEMMSNH